jgi:hypothetical protein
VSADATDPTADDAAEVEDLAALWRELDDAREARGWTIGQLARKVADLSKEDCNYKTLHDRIHNARRIPWSKAYWIVEALKLDSDAWRGRWERAEGQQRPAPATRPESTAPVPTQEPERDAVEQREVPDQQTQPGPAPQPPQTVTESSPRRRRLLPLIFTGFGGVVVGATVSGLIVWSTTRSEADNASPIACALVAVPSAEVFQNPGQSESLLTKREGQRITMPRDVPEIPGHDGRQYRLVRTPSRTPTGHAYMLAETLRFIDC